MKEEVICIRSLAERKPQGLNILQIQILKLGKRNKKEGKGGRRRRKKGGERRRKRGRKTER